MKKIVLPHDTPDVLANITVMSVILANLSEKLSIKHLSEIKDVKSLSKCE